MHHWRFIWMTIRRPFILRLLFLPARSHRLPITVTLHTIGFSTYASCVRVRYKEKSRVLISAWHNNRWVKLHLTEQWSLSDLASSEMETIVHLLFLESFQVLVRFRNSFFPPLLNFRSQEENAENKNILFWILTNSESITRKVKPRINNYLARAFQNDVNSLSARTAVGGSFR